MHFCPRCHSMVLLATAGSGQSGECNSLTCPACPFKYSLYKTVSRQVPLSRKKQVDDVLGGEDAWKNVDSTDATCPKCEYPRAYFMQIQIRSADEPSSIFYKCCRPECGHQWREG